MRLTRLELVGFKSFAQKTVLDFSAGIAAVVGPNGSGKSNIIDALRWILGERDAKNIRGTKAEDLIFSGTPERPRMGLAQATIVFDNQDHFFPLDYGEILIQRRVSRDGLSQYLINGAEVRLKDVIDFFAQSRLGTKGFTIIRQGDSDLFVRSSPEERREMLEEILGLRQFQIKKHDALNKLKNTKINIDKVEALIQEISPHLRMLKRQTAKWEKYDELVSELKSLEESYFGFKRAEIEADWQPLQPELEAIQKKIKNKDEELQKLLGELRDIEKDQPKDDRTFSDEQARNKELLTKRAAAEKEIGRLEAKIEFLTAAPRRDFKENELINLLEEVGRVLEENAGLQDIHIIKTALEDLAKKVKRFLAGGEPKEIPERKELEKNKEKLMQELRILDEALGKITESENQLRSRFQEFNAMFRKAYETVETKKNELNGLTNEKQKLLFAEERIRLRRSDLENQVSQIGRRLSEIPDFTGDRAGFDFHSVEKRMFRLRGELAGIGEVDQAVIKEAGETEARYEFLSKQLEDLKKAFVDLKTLIKDLDQRIHTQFTESLKLINEEFNNYFRMMFGGGRAKISIQRPEPPEVQEEAVVAEGGESMQKNKTDEEDDTDSFDRGGILVDVTIPRKHITGLDMLSGGEKSLVSIAALFALISVSPPPFLVLDEADAALDEQNTLRFANLVKEFSKKTQFIIVTHNRATMEAADILYGVTMREDGTSRVLSLKFEEAPAK